MRRLRNGVAVEDSTEAVFLAEASQVRAAASPVAASLVLGGAFPLCAQAFPLQGADSAAPLGFAVDSLVRLADFDRRPHGLWDLGADP